VTFSILSCLPHISASCISSFQAPHKTVILSGARHRSIANRGLRSAESKDLGGAQFTHAARSFSPPKPHLADPPRSFPWTEDKKCRSCTRASGLKSLEPHRQDKHHRGPSESKSPVPSVAEGTSAILVGKCSWELSGRKLHHGTPTVATQSQLDS
jgi:hypothetical protein